MQRTIGGLVLQTTTPPNLTAFGLPRDVLPYCTPAHGSDLAREAQFLSNLSHPNVIKLRGLALPGAAGFADGPCGYFLIIDRLSDTLDKRIDAWHGKGRRRSSLERMAAAKAAAKAAAVASFKKGGSGRRSSAARRHTDPVLTDDDDAGDNELVDRVLAAALQISAAMMYLHKHSVIFRDLKPDNIGFDVRDDVKIFDFGLSRFTPDDANPYNDAYEMSGAGSPRYMAPECLVGLDYNLKADVYTFGVVLWQMLTGETPYSYVKNRAELEYCVVEERLRPHIHDDWPWRIKGMLECSFDAVPDLRPKMQLFFGAIRKVLASVRGGDMTGLSHAAIHRRRSLESISCPNV